MTTVTRKEAIRLPSDLATQVDAVVQRTGFGSREAFVVAAVCRLLDHYRTLLTPQP